LVRATLGLHRPTWASSCRIKETICPRCPRSLV